MVLNWWEYQTTVAMIPQGKCLAWKLRRGCNLFQSTLSLLSLPVFLIYIVLFLCRWGKFVSLHPFPVILACLLATALSGLGFLRFRWGRFYYKSFIILLLNKLKVIYFYFLYFRMEYQANLLWIPKDSPYNLNEVNISNFLVSV